jgi:predicted amidohydrolase
LKEYNLKKIGYLQTNPVFGEKEQNLKQISEMLEGCRNADLKVLTELSTTGYAFKAREELSSAAESIPDGESTSQLIEVAKKINTHLVAGIAEREGDKFYNSAILVGPEGYIGKYRKIHLFKDEKEYFTPGDLEFPVFEVKEAKIGIMICFDWIFPEAARVLALKGAEIICHPSNLVLPYAFEVMRARAIENRVFIITSSRTGEERGLSFQGKSQIVNPDMNVIAKSGKEGEEVKVVEIDLDLARNKKVTPKNDVLSDRRPEFYKKILERK